MRFCQKWHEKESLERRGQVHPRKVPSQEIAYERVMKSGDDVRHEEEEENEEAGVGKNSEMISSMKKRMYKENEEAEYESVDRFSRRFSWDQKQDKRKDMRVVLRSQERSRGCGHKRRTQEKDRNEDKVTTDSRDWRSRRYIWWRGYERETRRRKSRD